jgi:hypothetical protein
VTVIDGAGATDSVMVRVEDAEPPPLASAGAIRATCSVGSCAQP